LVDFFSAISLSSPVASGAKNQAPWTNKLYINLRQSSQCFDNKRWSSSLHDDADADDDVYTVLLHFANEKFGM
jgi:hypothetical protein